MDKTIIGKRLRDRRDSMSLTREEFAEMIDVSPQFLAEIENGKKGMSVETLCKICENIHVSADYLLFGQQATGEKTTLAIETLQKIPSQYSAMVDDLLITLLRMVKKAESADK
ncbi:MAG: helix-turn-helix domain-containing protein [Deferribacteraceae bacterium]|jgi:transcriptional regulator with XRE-family HTH domain|nr:helix-turn-helix domain-containing protein [Deferribacteraceae bacterium]